MQLKEIVKAMVLMRPVNCLITMLVVFTGYFSAVQPGAETAIMFNQLLLVGLAAFFIAAAGNIHNDIIDIEIDKINKPNSPLPKGNISRINASSAFIIFALSGLAAGYRAGKVFFIGALSVLALLVLYNLYIQRTLIYGNFLIALIGAFTFIYGGLLSISWELSIIPAIFAFLIHFAREIVKDAEDMEGDRRAGMRTIAIVDGEATSRKA
ncbi:MAG: UbiA family prenyltransferase, partial [bacterium]